MTPEALKFLNPDTRVFDTLSWIAVQRAKRHERQAPRSYTLAELRAKAAEYAAVENEWGYRPAYEFLNWIEQRSHTAPTYPGIIPTSLTGTST